MIDEISVSAPAKLNLALSVGPRTASGMHPICSWMVTVDLCDELTVTRLKGGRLSRYAIIWHADAKRRSDIDWSITKDLAVRAHRALEAHVERRLPVQLKLEKRIPVGGGLGGGSADAAAMLHACNALFDLGLETNDLAAIGATLGSDVPFLVQGGSALVEGLGDQIAPHDETPDLHAVIAFPPVHCPTGEVYDTFDELGAASLRAADVRGLTTSSPSANGCFNDLAPAAVRLLPQLEGDLNRLSELAERPAHLSGSGSAIFVICDDPLHGEALAETTESRLNLPAVVVQSYRDVAASA